MYAIFTIYIETIKRVMQMDINKLIEQAKNTSTKRVSKDKYLCLYWNKEKEPENYRVVKEFMKKHDLTPTELKLFLIQIIKSKNN